MSKQPDLHDRHLAVSRYDRNQVIVAGAGTGKTSLLIERLLNQIIERELPLAEIAAMTFTEKAALEMRSRLEAGLRRLAAGGPPSEEGARGDEADRAFAHLSAHLQAGEIRRRAIRALAELPRSFMGTFHAFCSGLLRSHPLEAGVDPDFVIDEGPRLAALYEEIWESFLDGEDGPEGARHDAWAAQLRWADLHELRALTLGLADFSIPHLPGPGEPVSHWLPDASEILAPRLRERLASIDRVLGDEISRGPQSYLAAALELVEPIAREGLAGFNERLEHATFQPARGPRKPLRIANAPVASGQPEATALAKQTLRLLDQLHTVDDAAIASAVSLVLPCAHRMRDEARRQGLLSFDALLSLTRELLVSHPRIRHTLGHRYRLLLVDEFQDTDPLQYEIVFFLAEDPGSRPSRDAYATRLAPGKLFIVGDPKQSIYHFRAADIAAYRRAVEHVCKQGGQRLSLTTCWRSLPEILRPLNPLFESLLQPTTEERTSLDPGFEPMVSGRDERGDGPRVELWRLPIEGADGGLSVEEARISEARSIASWLASEIAADRVQPGEVAILLRATPEVHLYLRALRERAIPCVAETRRAPLDRPEIRELRGLLRALANPSDAPAVLSVLRSPLTAATDRDLLRFARARSSTWDYLEIEPDAELHPAVARGFALLRRWHERAGRLPVAELLERLFDETPLLVAHAGSSEGPHRIAGLRRLSNRLCDLARRLPGCSLRGLLRWLERDDALPGLPEAGGRVRLMSVHAAKGLQFGTVILPDLARRPGGGGRRDDPDASVAWLTDPGRAALRVGDRVSSGWLRRLWDDERHAEAESKRLLYVACTRAEDRLILCHVRRSQRERQSWLELLSRWDPEGNGTEAEDFRPPAEVGLQTPPLTPGELRLTEPVGRFAGAQPVLRGRAAASRARAHAAPAMRSPSGLREDEERREESGWIGADTPAGRVARCVGLALHEALERWTFRDADELRDLTEAAVMWACRTGLVDPDAVRPEAQKIIRSLLASELPGYLATREILGRELPLLYRDEHGQGWTGTLDLLYRDPDGRLVVADYKTDSEPDAERHRPQLECYARGLQRALPGEAPPALELIFLRTGERRRIE
ncbi:MAG: UvrD-helicase domain-containing protein [Myxococcota bacterium]